MEVCIEILFKDLNPDDEDTASALRALDIVGARFEDADTVMVTAVLEGNLVEMAIQLIRSLEDAIPSARGDRCRSPSRQYNRYR